MKPEFIRASVAFAAIGVLSAVMLLLSSCSSVQRSVVVPATIEGAEFVGNDACARCHEEIAAEFPSSAHATIHAEGMSMEGESGCESCHGPGSLHVSAPARKGEWIINPKNDPASCYQCHMDIRAEFRHPHHHPLPEGEMQCVQCHDPHASDIMKPAGGLAMARLNESCAECHREQTRPFVFEHEAMREGCVTCHHPHGSIHDKMLTSRDANLCLRCHSQVQTAPGNLMIGKVNHASFLRMGNCWAAGCHTAVHGSNFHPKMLY